MLRFKTFYLFLIVLTTILLISCQTEQNPVESNRTINQQPNLSKASIPFGATIDSAVFFINVTTANGEEVTIHRITEDWQEMSVTWNNFAGSFDANTEGSFIPIVTGWYSVDITSLVRDWFDSTYSNYGLLLKEASPDMFQNYSSRETTESPYLKIWWTVGSTNGFDSTNASADSYIQSDLGDSNFGDSLYLSTGWQDTTERQSLVNFQIEVVYTSCTRGYGYWKTHSIYGPAPYDSTWSLLGEDSTFFLSNQSNYQVMWTPPSGGNAYYILAHKYIAAQLNILNGADPSEIQEAFDQATDLFETYTPEYIGSLKGNDPIRQQFILLNGELSDYNDGIIGPGKCSEFGSITPSRHK